MEKDYKAYLEESNDVLEAYETSEKGLSSQEADKRLEEFGANKLVEPPKVSNIKRFFDQMKDPMIIVLLCAAALSLVTSIYEG